MIIETIVDISIILQHYLNKWVLKSQKRMNIVMMNVLLLIYIYIVVGRIKNLVFNPLSESLDTMDNLTDLVDRLMNLLTDLPANLRDVSDFNYTSFENVIKDYEDWILKIID